MLEERLREEPSIFLRLSENSLTVARTLRRCYLDVTIKLCRAIRERLLRRDSSTGLTIRPIGQNLGEQPLTVCFIDGGVGEAEIFFRVPLIIRGGVFRIKEGEHDLERRETFEFFPVLIGELEGGEKSRSDYASVVRIIVELAAVWHVLQDSRYSDVKLIMLHGPLLYRLSAYTDHWFYESDIEHMAKDYHRELLQGYRDFCKEDPVSRNWFSVWEKDKKIRANYMIAYLLKSITRQCNERGTNLTGVVERGSATEICKKLIVGMLKDGELTDKLGELIKLLLPNRSGQYVKDAEEIIERGKYNDSLIFSMVLEPGEYLSLWKAEERYSGFSGDLEGFGDWLKKLVPIAYTYLKPVVDSLAIRVEFPLSIAQEDDAVQETIAKVYRYARLLPNYAFPIGLDIVDKFARVPRWMVEAYRKYILFNFGRLSWEDQFNQEELERILLFYHLNQRSFFNRPKA